MKYEAEQMITNSIVRTSGFKEIDITKTFREQGIDEGTMFDIVTVLEEALDIDLEDAGVEDIDKTVEEFISHVVAVMGVE